MKLYLSVLCGIIVFLVPQINVSSAIAQDLDGDAALDYSDDIFDDDFEDLLPPSLKLKLEQPTLEITYTSATATRKNVPDNSVAGFGIIEGRIGATKNFTQKIQQNLLKERTNFLYFGGGATSLNAINNAAGAATELWRFGLGENTGRGWKFGDVGLLLNYGSAISWTGFTFEDTTTLDALPALNDFHDAFRFGKMVQGGMGLKVGDDIALKIGYEQSVVFHRHLALYWMTSEIIEGIAQGAAEAFVRKIEKSSPKSAPVVAFILHNGIGFGMSMLRKNKMNWPFNTEPALVYGGIKIGASVRF